MSKAVKANVAPGGAAPEIPFEVALKKLETIVEAMESQELPLETLLVRFEEGTQLAKICQTKLAEAELKIQKLEKDNAGDIAVRPFDPGATQKHEPIS